MQYIHQITEVLPQAGQFFHQMNFSDLPLQKRRSVLLIDEDPSQQPIWRFMLEEADRDVLVHWAANVEEAEQAILDKQSFGESFDLIISDVILRGRNEGLGVWRKYGNKAPFIFTGRISPKSFMRMLGSEESVPVYLPKPLEARHCLDIIRTVLGFHCAYHH